MRKEISTCCVLLIAGFFLLLQSCSLDPCGADKDVFLERYHAFMDEVKAAELGVSDEGWQDYDAEFKTFVEVCYEGFESEMSGREKRRFWTKAMGYYYNRYGKSLGKELFEKENSGSTLQEIWDDPQGAFEELFE